MKDERKQWKKRERKRINQVTEEGKGNMQNCRGKRESKTKIGVEQGRVRLGEVG